MCGRFALHAHPDVVSLQFGLSSVPIFEPHYNIAPAARVLIVRGDGA
ncbi:MAG: SOS response-associated peptidase family protein, partial [Steroidobacteraceae bacterium]